MAFTFKEIDNIVDSERADEIERHMLRAVSWRYNPMGRMPEEQWETHLPNGLQLDKKLNGFSHRIFQQEFPEVDPIALRMVEPMMDYVMDMIPLSLEVSRVRAGMFFPDPNGGIHYPHVDVNKPHYTLVYYVNNSDGDTYMWNEKYETEEYPTYFTLLDSISPKKGKALLFNGMHYHSSSRPKVSRERIAITINFIMNEWS